MNRFKHYLFTRINIPYSTTKDKPYEKNVVDASKSFFLDPEWLQRRVDLFNTYCLPSVENQNIDDFEWFLLFHKDTPPEFVKAFSSYPKIEAVVSGLGDRDTAVKIMEEGSEGFEFVINTNLDSDDGISSGFMRTVQTEFRGVREFINIPRGMVMKDGTIYGRKSEHAPFRSLVEPVDNIQSMYVTIHGGSKLIAPVRQIEGVDARWLQVLHGENLTNKVARRSGDKGRPFSDFAHMFGIET